MACREGREFATVAARTLCGLPRLAGWWHLFRRRRRVDPADSHGRSGGGDTLAVVATWIPCGPLWNGAPWPVGVARLRLSSREYQDHCPSVGLAPSISVNYVPCVCGVGRFAAPFSRASHTASRRLRTPRPNRQHDTWRLWSSSPLTLHVPRCPRSWQDSEMIMAARLGNEASVSRTS